MEWVGPWCMFVPIRVPIAMSMSGNMERTIRAGIFGLTFKNLEEILHSR